MNRWIGTGNLVADPEKRTSNNGNVVCNFRIAVNRRFANAQGVRESDFIPVVCFKQTAEFASKYLLKGRKVAVEGSIQTRSYDAQDGSKRYVTEIIADNIEALDKAEQKAEAPSDVVEKAQQLFGEGFTEVADDSLPF